MTSSKIYTDGGCKHRFGAYAYIIVEDGEIVKEYADICDNTTNQRMELKAVIEALKNVDEAEVYSDSAYVVNCINDKWYVSWLKNGWLTKSKTPVKNKDLWSELLELYFKKKVTFFHVKGHNGNRFNEYVDSLCSNLIGVFGSG